MTVTYEGFTLEGQAVSGVIEAPNRNAAQTQLREQGVIAVRLGERGRGRRTKSARLSPERLGTFLRQASILVGTGTPIVEALVAIERQAGDERLRSVVGGLRRRVEEGAALSEAMAAMPESFDSICRTMTAAGEAAGILERMLGDLAEVYRRQARLRRAIVGALAYPASVITAASATLVGLVVFVLPRFRAMFDAVQAPVPPVTAFLMAVGQFLGEHWIGSTLVAAVALGATVALAFTSRVRRAFANALLTFPIARTLTRALLTAQLARCLGLLLDSKVGLIDALNLTRDATRHPAYVDMLARAEAAVSRGESLASVLNDDRCILPSVRQAIASGERAGRLGAVLTQVARHLDEDNEAAVRGLARTIEPLLLGGLGIVIGFVAISLFLPLFDVAASAGAGAR